MVENSNAHPYLDPVVFFQAQRRMTVIALSLLAVRDRWAMWVVSGELMLFPGRKCNC